LASNFVESLYEEYFSNLITINNTKKNVLFLDVETQVSQRNKDYCFIITDNSFFSFINNNTHQKRLSLETSDLLELSFIGKNNLRDDKLEITQTFYLEIEKNFDKKEIPLEISENSSFTIYSNKKYQLEITDNNSVFLYSKKKVYLEIASLSSVFIESNVFKNPVLQECENSSFSLNYEKKPQKYSINSHFIEIESNKSKNVDEYSLFNTKISYEIDTLLFRLNYIKDHFLKNNMIIFNDMITYTQLKKNQEYIVSNLDNLDIISGKIKTISNHLDNTSSFSLGNNKCSIEIMKKSIENKKISLNEIKSLNFKNYRIVTRNSVSNKKDHSRDDESLNKAKEVTENSTVKNISSSFYHSDFRSSFETSFDINMNGSNINQPKPGILKVNPSEIKTNDELVKKIINKLEYCLKYISL